MRWRTVSNVIYARSLKAFRQIQPFLRFMARGQAKQSQDVGDLAVDSASDSCFRELDGSTTMQA